MLDIKKVLFLLQLFLLISIPALKAQEQKPPFSSDTTKYIIELTAYFKNVGDFDEPEARRVLSTVTYQWTSNLFTGKQKIQIHANSIQFADQKLQVAPYFIVYFKVLSNMLKTKAVPSAYDVFQKGLKYCLSSESPTKNLLLYLEQTDLLLASNAFLKTTTEAWYMRNAVYHFAFDTVPFFNFTSGSLAGVVRNDSACIYETKGRFYPLSQLWIGKGGKVTWERAGYDKDQVFAKLSDYQINTRTMVYSADSVQFYHGLYFKKFLPGRLEDKAMVDATPESATYPKFTMNKGSKVYLNLFKDIEFSGRFGMEGSRVVGSATDKGNAQIEITHNKKTLISLRSPEVVIRTDRFVTARSIVTIYTENDSIFHPSLQVRYNLDENELVMLRTDEGLSQSPFFDTYHKLDIFSEAIYWKMNEDFMKFESLHGIRTGSEALFQSTDFFSAYQFDKLQGYDETNPAILVSAYIRKRKIDRFYTEDYADWIKKPYDQAKVQLINLANAGLLVYDLDQNFVQVQPRLHEYLATKSGVKDSDIIQFRSVVQKGSNASLDLRNNLLTIYGVKQVMLSDSQYVYVKPRNEKVIVSKNRDFSFNGTVHAGLFDFMSHECTFLYDKFSLSMPDIDSVNMKIPAWEPDANGERPLVKVKNVIAHMNGELLIDSPESKSGRKMLHQYPILQSKDTSYVFFDRRDIVDGVYKRDNFYFEINPFTMDSINSLPNTDLRFSGKLVSAGIFPDLSQVIRVQRDYSLGFSAVIPEPGIAAYGNKGNFADTLRLSNTGLRGSGRLTYLSSVTRSDDFLFTPAYTTAKIKEYNLAKTFGNVEFADAKAKEATIKWQPDNDLMAISNTKSGTFSMFNDKVTLSGSLFVSPTGLKGKGQLNFENTQIKSLEYNFKNESFTSDSADFRLMTDDNKHEALKVHGFNIYIDFAARTGNFKPADTSNAAMEFPLIRYICAVDEFDWLMDKKQFQLSNQTRFSRARYYEMSPEELIAFNPGKEVYTSTDPKQDSLSFFAMHALYDMTENKLQVEDARVLKIADAAIFPYEGKLTINKDGKMAELNRATIMANRSTLLYKFINSTVIISSASRYSAKGLFDYTPSEGDIFTLEMNNIATDNKGATHASTMVSDSLNFMLNRHFRFKGKLDINASDTTINFEGGYQKLHDCTAFTMEWIKLNAGLTPRNILIPVSSDEENTGNGNLRVSIYYSTTENNVKPGFFAKAENVTDPDIIAATGFLKYDAASSEYRVGDIKKIENPQLTGNMLALNTQRCQLTGEGSMQLAVNLGQLRMKSAGVVNYYSLVDSTSVNAMSSLDFFFSDEAIKVLADALNASDLKGIDISSRIYTRSLREYAGTEEADNILSELNLFGQYRKFPDVLNHTMLFSDLNLSFNKDLRSFISQGLIGISNLGSTTVNKYVKGYIEIGKRRQGDILNIYLEPDDSQWYFFSYANGTMQALSNNQTFNDKLVGLKESQRLIKATKGVPSYQFIIGTADKKAIFLRKMKQAAGE